MVSALDQQVFACAVLGLAGVAVGVWFDLLRAWRTVFQPGYWIAAVGDLLFWAVAGGTLAVALYVGNWGEMRLYVLVSILVGAGAYWLCASNVVRLCLIWLFRFLVLLARLVLELFQRLIWRPVVLLSLLVYKGLRWIVGILGRVLWWLTRPLLMPLYRKIEPYLLRLEPVYQRIRSIHRRIRAWLSRDPID